jgi:hypothetical protein
MLMDHSQGKDDVGMAARTRIARGRAIDIDRSKADKRLFGMSNLVLDIIDDAYDEGLERLLSQHVLNILRTHRFPF